MNNNYTLITEKTNKGFQHSLLYNGEPVRGSTSAKEINGNPTTTFLEDYAQLNEAVITQQSCNCIEIKFKLTD